MIANAPYTPPYINSHYAVVALDRRLNKPMPLPRTTNWHVICAPDGATYGKCLSDDYFTTIRWRWRIVNNKINFTIRGVYK